MAKEAMYISGPMTGLPGYNRAAFFAAEKRLAALGYVPINPAHIEGPKDAPWAFWMRRALTYLLTCQCIVMLPGWRDSRGAQLEKLVAEALGMTVYYWRDDELLQEDAELLAVEP